MSNICVNWQWLNSHKKPHISAALAWDHVRVELIHYLLTSVDEKVLKQLQILSHKDVIILIGKAELLPWINGIQYAGYDDIEPRLWRPSHKQPSVPISLLTDSLCQYYKQSALLIWDNPKVIIPINKAKIVDKQLLNTIASQCDKSL